MAIEVLAPAKINLTLEVLGRRPDGYHEILSVMQTVSVYDRVRIEHASGLEIDLSGPEAAGVPKESRLNLAYLAAEALLQAYGHASHGARIAVEKTIPTGMGLGGGSSDAAAVLRGLNVLWGLGLPTEALGRIAARLGSDVAFFLCGGAALASGRGEVVEPLPDAAPRAITLFLGGETIEEKTRRMYGLLSMADYSDGRATLGVAESIRRGRPVAEADLLNVFDRHVAAVAPTVGQVMDLCRDSGVAVHAAGGGMAFFACAGVDELPAHLVDGLARVGHTARACKIVPRQESLEVREV